MKNRFLITGLMVVSAIFVVSLIAQTAAAQTRPAAAAPAAKQWTPPKTTWGDPDLQGIYTSDDYIGVQLERQANFGTRLYLTDDEIKARQGQVETAAQNALQEFANPNGNVGT